MQIGTLVKMKGDPHNVLGVIIEVIDYDTHNPVHYKVEWLDELCDPSYAEAKYLEVVCK